MANNYLTDKEYWEKQISEFKSFEVTRNEFAPILQKYLPVDPGFTCTEVGAYPGANLCYMAKTFKYKPTAIELRDDVNDIINLFEYNGISELAVINNDFFQLKGLQFDVVTSFGFIEHFIDYETVIKRHVEMVKPNGYLVLSVPYLWGFQGFLRRLILKKEALVELHETHNLQIMKLSVVKQNLKNIGLQILYCEYVMGCRFWIPSDSPRIKPEMRWLANILAKLDKTILPKMPSSFLYSPMFLCIARKI